MTYEPVIAALADPTRRRILEMLRDGPRAVGDLAGELPVSRAAVSQHLRVLREADLVSETPEGTKRIYSAAPEGLIELRNYLENFWGEVLAGYAAGTERTRPPKKRRAKKRNR